MCIHTLIFSFELQCHTNLNLSYRRVVVLLGTSDDFSLHFFLKPSESTELRNQELIANSSLQDRNRFNKTFRFSENSKGKIASIYATR